MAQVELIMPKMGESIMEATILKWVKKVGDTVELDETILEIATDKVDSEIPSPVAGVITEILFEEEAVVEIGKVIAMIATEGEEAPSSSGGSDAVSQNGHSSSKAENNSPEPVSAPVASIQTAQAQVPVAMETSVVQQDNADVTRISPQTGRFYSPLVRNIAAQENISMTELDMVAGTGANGRVTKRDIKAYLADGRKAASLQANTTDIHAPAKEMKSAAQSHVTPASGVQSSGQDEIIEMDRMRKLIADHMVMSKSTSPHVTSFVEADVTDLVHWRNSVKGPFQKKHGEKITFTPIFVEAVAKAIIDFPMINVSVDGKNIIVKKNINVGMATALPSGNLIVPVIRNADQLNLIGLTKSVNDLAGRARNNKLKPDDIQGGTFTLTNVGTFGNVMGTPIINQPQVAILAAGAIRKKPGVVETEYGDLIAVRHMMFLSLSYDHRVVDGFLGGSFLRRVADYLEQFDTTQTV